MFDDFGDAPAVGRRLVFPLRVGKPLDGALDALASLGQIPECLVAFGSSRFLRQGGGCDRDHSYQYVSHRSFSFWRGQWMPALVGTTREFWEIDRGQEISLRGLSTRLRRLDRRQTAIACPTARVPSALGRSSLP